MSDTHWLVNHRIRPFTTRIDALFALNIAAEPWESMDKAQFDAYLERLVL